MVVVEGASVLWSRTTGFEANVARSRLFVLTEVQSIFVERSILW